MYFDLIFFFHSLNFSNSIIMTALDKWMFSTRHKLYTSWLYRYNVVCPRQGIWWCVFLIYLFFSFLQPKFINPKLVANRIVLSMPSILTKRFHYIVIIIVRHGYVPLLGTWWTSIPSSPLPRCWCHITPAQPPPFHNKKVNKQVFGRECW